MCMILGAAQVAVELQIEKLPSAEIVEGTIQVWNKYLVVQSDSEGYKHFLTTFGGLGGDIMIACGVILHHHDSMMTSWQQKTVMK